MKSICNAFVTVALRWPEQVAAHLTWLAPLIARIVIGQFFVTSGLGKLNNLEITTGNFIS